jgi:hypothetical protein
VEKALIALRFAATAAGGQPPLAQYEETTGEGHEAGEGEMGI